MGRIYLDWNATTPPLEGAVDAMMAVAREAWANPSSVHTDGRRARAVVEDARASVAALAGADVRDVLFTSGGTEANNLALRSAFAAEGGVLVTSRLEHPSITRVAEALEREKRAHVRWLAVTAAGCVDLSDLTRALGEPSVRLLALSAVNHETGVVQPVREALELAAARGVPVHVDAVQAFGRLEDVAREAASRSLAAHKLRGPKGIGALVFRPGVRLTPILFGGAQERGLRPGTVDPVLAAGFGAAARHAASGPARYRALEPLRDRLEEELRGLGAERNGDGPRAPHVTNVAVAGWLGPELVAALDLEGVSVSSGSACSAGTVEASPVLEAMLGPERARSSVRVSMGEGTTADEVDAAVAAFRRVLARGPA